MGKLEKIIKWSFRITTGFAITAFLQYGLRSVANNYDVPISDGHIINRALPFGNATLVQRPESSESYRVRKTGILRGHLAIDYEGDNRVDVLTTEPRVRIDPIPDFITGYNGFENPKEIFYRDDSLRPQDLKRFEKADSLLSWLLEQGHIQ